MRKPAGSYQKKPVETWTVQAVNAVSRATIVRGSLTFWSWCNLMVTRLPKRQLIGSMEFEPRSVRDRIFWPVELVERPEAYFERIGMEYRRATRGDDSGPGHPAHNGQCLVASTWAEA